MPPPTSTFPRCCGRNQRGAPRAGCSMIPEFVCLLCFGLCAGQGSRATDESFPKPSLRAWPSSVVSRKSNVMLQCQTSTKNVNFVLRKGKNILQSVQSWASTEGLAEFHLTDLKTDNAGQYTCEYYRLGSPYISSQPSDVLLLLVTGDLPKPSLQAHQRGEVTAGDTVTLQCQRPDNIFVPVMFALLKAGAAGPIRVQSPAGKETDFSLQTVTVSDAGNYSCVYFLMKAPFLTSQPSDHLEIRVTVFGVCCFAFLENVSGCSSKRSIPPPPEPLLPPWASLRVVVHPADGNFMAVPFSHLEHGAPPAACFSGIDVVSSKLMFFLLHWMLHPASSVV
uniref:T-cell-interacting, activating receptor on myeloid cells protein 1-like isoform X1 n=1 Tax=Halichoerus grypus TaxID=9711 RepID=UPI00165A1348|nr:T-cell-interacting, activating receptor on myeloid cells protein 1-like isoform X1 [Halichoerus grypus]